MVVYLREFREMLKNFLDDIIKQLRQPKNRRLVILMCAGVVLVTFTFFFNRAVRMKSEMIVQNTESAVTADNAEVELQKKMIEAQKEMGDEFYSKASNNAPIPPAAVPQSQQPGASPLPAQNANPVMPKTTEKYVSLKVINYGKTNPFEPYIDTVIASTNPMYDLPSPPLSLIENPEAENLMKTTISGIMYDAFSPSAIVNVNGNDHLVRKGDKINGYRILNITKDRVVVQNGTNVYRATVGETLVAQNSGIKFNDVYNLPDKFGGVKGAGRNMIYINSLN